MIQGARYERQGGQHFNPYVYDDIKTIADHVHYAGNKGPHAANGRSDAAGGGHAHAGLMLYQGGSFPEKYNGQIFMNNIHGARLNMDIPERKGSGFVGHHGADFVKFNDQWSQILNFLYDQDGSIYMIDWYDKNQCHHNNVDGHDRSNGRIFKLVYNNQKWTPIDLRKKNSHELVELLSNKNQFYARHARRILQERGADPLLQEELISLVENATTGTAQLNALWALHVTGALTDAEGLKLLNHGNEFIRAWTIQLLCEKDAPRQPLLDQFTKMAAADPSPVVRLYLASVMQKTPPQQRWPVLKNLLAHAEDINDHNLPLMYWYATEGAVGADPSQALKLLSDAKIPKVRQYIARRIASKAVAQN